MCNCLATSSSVSSVFILTIPLRIQGWPCVRRFSCGAARLFLAHHQPLSTKGLPEAIGDAVAKK